MPETFIPEEQPITETGADRAAPETAENGDKLVDNIHTQHSLKAAQVEAVARLRDLLRGKL